MMTLLYVTCSSVSFTHCKKLHYDNIENLIIYWWVYNGGDAKWRSAIRQNTHCWPSPTGETPWHRGILRPPDTTASWDSLKHCIPRPHNTSASWDHWYISILRPPVTSASWDPLLHQHHDTLWYTSIMRPPDTTACRDPLKHQHHETLWYTSILRPPDTTASWDPLLHQHPETPWYISILRPPVTSASWNLLIQRHPETPWYIAKWAPDSEGILLQDCHLKLHVCRGMMLGPCCFNAVVTQQQQNCFDPVLCLWQERTQKDWHWSLWVSLDISGRPGPLVAYNWSVNRGAYAENMQLHEFLSIHVCTNVSHCQVLVCWCYANDWRLLEHPAPPHFRQTV